jgi:hypothetical protein
MFSLLIRLANCLRSGCSTAVSFSEMGSQRRKITNFPVKFPVSTEFVRRRVRSALRRQPTSPAPRETTPNRRRNARQWRAFPNSVDGLQPPDFARGGAKLPEVSGRMPKYSRRRRPETGSVLTAWGCAVLLARSLVTIGAHPLYVRPGFARCTAQGPH